MLEQEVTIHARLPQDLLRQAQAMTGEDVEHTLRISLERLVTKQHDHRPQPDVFQRLLAWQGKQQFPFSLDELREDREL